MMSIEERLAQFIQNDFHHLSVKVAKIEGQLRVIQALLLVLTAAAVGLVVSEMT
jgi:hypothetical protein